MSVRWRRFGDLFHLERRDPGLGLGDERAEIGIRSFGRGTFHKPPVSTADLGGKRVFEIREGDLLISNIFAWEGAIAVAGPGDDRLIGSHRFMTWTPTSSSVYVPFVREYLLSTRGLDAIGKASPGSAGRNRTLGVRALEEIEIPVPDLPTQRAIAARLDGVARARDDISDRAGRRPRMSAIAPETVGRALAALDLPDVPLASLYTIVGDVVRPEDDPGKADRFVGLEHVTRDTGNRTGSSGVVDRKGRKLRFAAGDVLYGYLRPYLNKVWVTDGPGLCSVEQYVLRPADGVDPRLLGHVLRQQPTLDAVNAATHNLQLPRIRTALLGAIRVPDIRRVAPDTTEALDDINERASRLAALAGRSGHLVESLLPAARNEEFAHLLAG